MELQGKVAVITGASRGLGAGIAAEFLRQGLRLGLCARHDPALSASASIVTTRCDVADGAAVDAFCDAVVARFGGIDLWINNAGLLEPIAPLRDLTTEAFRQHLDVNVVGVFHGSHAFIRALHRSSRPGVLINISSGAGRKAYAGWSAYGAGKAAVDRLTETIHLEERGHGLRAYAVAPGIIDTEMQALIRACDAARFPAVERFRKLKRDEAFSSPAFVAKELLKIAFDPDARPEGPILRLPDEHA